MDNNKIYLGDTLETLKSFPSDYFDITVTSPPYNKKKVSGKLVSEVKYKDADDSKDECQYQLEQIDILNEICRVTKPSGHVFYNHKLRWFDGVLIHPYEWIFATVWNIRQEIIWDRTIAANIRGWRFWQTEERIFWLQKGIVRGDELKSKHAKMSSIWKIFPETKCNDHPAPFPIALPTRCIYSIADETKGLNVLDPYCGIGSTLVAAKYLGQNYVGIDCTKEYIDVAENRLKNISGSKDEQKMKEECSLHKVEKSYSKRKK